MLTLLCFPTRNNIFGGVVNAAGNEDEAQQQRRLQDPLVLPDEYVDDVYHCDNPFDSEKNIIACDPVSFRWNVAELMSTMPPAQCDENTILGLAISTEGFQDRDEPCVLWYMLYGGFPDDTVPSPFYGNEGEFCCFSVLVQLDYRVGITRNAISCAVRIY